MCGGIIDGSRFAAYAGSICIWHHGASSRPQRGYAARQDFSVRVFLSASGGYPEALELNYYINITLFPWLEVGYTCTLHKIGLPQYGYSYKFRNQDRQFSARLRVWKEGWWKEWTPQIVVGANDPSTNDVLGDPNKDDYGFTGTSSVGNGHWNRYYIVATKHFGVKNVGELGMHFGYVYNKRLDYHRNGPVAGVNFQFALPATSFWMKAVNGLNVIAEYDSYSVNCGIGYNFWKDYISGVVELTQCKYPSAGMVFRIHLK